MRYLYVRAAGSITPRQGIAPMNTMRWKSLPDARGATAKSCIRIAACSDPPYRQDGPEDAFPSSSPFLLSSCSSSYIFIFFFFFLHFFSFCPPLSIFRTSLSSPLSLPPCPSVFASHAFLRIGKQKRIYLIRLKGEDEERVRLFSSILILFVCCIKLALRAKCD